MSETPVPPTPNTLPPSLEHEHALVSGALQAPDDSALLYTPSKNAEGNDEQNSAQRTSLEALVNVASGAYVPLPDDPDAISTAIPDSIDEQPSIDLVIPVKKKSSAAIKATLPVKPVKSQPKPKPYAQALKFLRPHLPHLNNVLGSGRQKRVNVECYDYSNNALTSRRTFTRRKETDDFYMEGNVSLRQILEGHPEDVQLRLIVAEDLSTDLIECLGSSLNISPEVFEEHLLNAGWQNGEYGDAESDTWITRDMAKNYRTLRWYRPVKRKMQRPYSAFDWETLLDPREPSMSWTEAVPNDAGKPYGVGHSTRPSTNILRRDWNLRTDAETHVAVGDMAAWEEKATIWSRQIGGCSVVVLLLDPLPILQDQMSGAAIALQKLGVYEPIGLTTHSEDQRHAGDSRPPAQEELSPPPKALVRSRTFVRPSQRSGNKWLNLGAWLTGKPMVGDEPSNERDAAGEDAGQSADPEKGQRSKKRETRGKRVRDPKTRSGVAKLLARLTRNNPKKSEGVDGAEEPDVLAERVGAERITLEPLARCMFEGVFPRGPVVDYDFLMSTLKVELLAEHMDNNRSTARSLAQWIQHENNHQHSRATQGDPLGSLFAIAQRDTLNVLRLMDLALKEIGQHILDDTLIQQRLIHWRHLLERFDTELQQLEDSLRRFATFIGQVGRPDANGGARSATDHLLQDCVAQILTLGQRTKSSYTSLMANMSIVESKRGIAEAESVTKLTELAFFFIPLTFSASIFSMQVKELSSSRVSLSTFFILAIIITTCSYALRLFIRSASIISVRRHYMKEIRADAGLQPGASIPTTSFLIWVWHRIGLLTTIVTVIVGILAVPLAFLWTRDMNHGYQAILTVLELVLVLVAAHFVARTLLYTDARGLHFRRDIFKPAPRQKGQEQQVPLVRQWRDLFTIPSWLSSRIFLIALVATAVAVGLVVAVWTRLLEKGIKVGVIIVLGFIYIGSLVVLLLKAIF